MNLFKVENVVINLDQVIGARFWASTTNESGDEPAKLVILTTERQENGASGVTVLEGKAAEQAWSYISRQARVV